MECELGKKYEIKRKLRKIFFRQRKKKHFENNGKNYK